MGKNVRLTAAEIRSFANELPAMAADEPHLLPQVKVMQEALYALAEGRVPAVAIEVDGVEKVFKLKR